MALARWENFRAPTGWLRYGKLIIGCAFVAGALIVVAGLFDVDRIVARLHRLSPEAIGLALALLVINQALGGLRYHLLIRSTGYGLTLAGAYRQNTYSLAGGLLLFNFFGQSLTRAALLGRSSGFGRSAFVLTGFERILSFGWLVGLAVLGALFVFGRISIAGDTGRYLALVLIGIGIVTVAVCARGIGARQRRQAGRALRGPFPRLVGAISVVTIGMHATMAAAYVALALAIAPETNLAAALPSAFIIMLAASLPISLAGWGVRELSAGYVFAAQGLPVEAGVALGLSIGLLSLAALGVNLLAAFAIPTSPGPRDRGDAAGALAARRLFAIVAWVLPSAAAGWVLFQVRFVRDSGATTVNLSDGIAVIGGCTALALGFGRTRWRDIWRVPGLHVAFGLMGAVLLGGFLLGWARVGLTDWALYNRVIGGVVLGGYLLTGALAVALGGRVGGRLFVRVFIVAVSTVLVLEFAVREFAPPALFKSVGWLDARFLGFAGNPNTFAFQILLALGLALGIGKLWPGRAGAFASSALLGLLVSGVWLSASRAGWVAGAVVIALGVFAFGYPLRRLIFGTAGVGGLLAAIAAVNGGSSISVGSMLKITGRFSHVTPDRMESLAGGWSLWLDHPLFGAGLGVFSHGYEAAKGNALIIHNTYLWLLAEFGAVGFCLMAIAPILVVRHILRPSPGSGSRTGRTRGWRLRGWRPRDWRNTATILCLIVLGIMSMAHEMAYQRAFWLVMGVLLAAPLSLGLGAKPAEGLNRAEGAKQVEGDASGSSGAPAVDKPQPPPTLSGRT